MLKVGDKVKIVKSFDGNDYPYLGWAEEMQPQVGLTGEIIKDDWGANGYEVHVDNCNDYVWPRECLEKI